LISKTKKKHRIGTIIAKEWVFGVIRPPSLSLSILFREYHLTGNYQLKKVSKWGILDESLSSGIQMMKDLSVSIHKNSPLAMDNPPATRLLLQMDTFIMYFLMTLVVYRTATSEHPSNRTATV